MNRSARLIEKVLNRPREISFVNLSQKILNTQQDAILEIGPKHILEDSINLKETIPRTKSVIEMLLKNDRHRFRVRYQGELERKMRECYKDREDRLVLKKTKRDKEIVCLHSYKTERIIIMKRKEYNSKIKDVIVKMDAESVEKDPNEVLIEKTAV